MRRARLDAALAKVAPPVHVTQVTTDVDTARRWFEIFEGAGLDGLIAKAADPPYAPGKRLMFKVKHARTADVVVAGFRWHKSGPVVGSLLLGLYDDAGALHHVGVCASFTAARRAELVEELAPYRENVTGHPWTARRGRQRRGSASPGAEPVERRQEPRVGGAAPRVGRRGRLRRDGGRPVPAHRPFPALAAGP